MKQRYLFTGILLFIIQFTAGAQGVYQFWGSTAFGGPNDLGAIFKTDGNGNNFQITHQFMMSNPGATPGYAAMVGYNGKFYGTTIAGGSNNAGVIFEWDPATNVYVNKYSMNGTSGASPYGGLTMQAGKFYGITANGGLNDAGVLFEWDPAANVYTKKIDLNTIGGKSGFGNLTEQSGKFYGITSRGGINDVGILFEWNPATNIAIKKIDFTNGANGKNPLGSLSLYNNKFYGTTSRGGIGVGVIFEWDPATNTYTKEVDFNYTDGASPHGSLTMHDGKFYGTTYSGGMNDQGVLFEWDPASNEYLNRVEMQNYSDGRHPIGDLVYTAGKFYGMTSGHIQGSNTEPMGGVVFEWDPISNLYTNKLNLDISTGYYPQGSFAVDNGKLYGMTQIGGSNNSGVLFQWNTQNNSYTKKIDFNGVDGRRPGGLKYAAGKILGVTQWGGDSYGGSIFDLNVESNQFSKLANMAKATGSNAFGSLAAYNGRYYGITSKGGLFNNGVIYEYDPATGTITDKYDLAYSDGYHPYGTLTMYNGKFYGLNELGGNDDIGTMFEWDPATNVYTKLVDFDGTSGSHPYGSLTLKDNKMYGMAGLGGLFGSGVIFEWDLNAHAYTKKIDFDGTNGDYPRGNLTLLNDKFYGMTEQGGINAAGVLFEWDPAVNILIKKIDLADATGSHPYGSLTVNSGKLYGITGQGGANGSGVIFEWEPANNIYQLKSSFSNSTAGSPNISNDLVAVPAPVAKGTGGTCVNFPSVTIDNSNNNTWVPITDNNGNAVAEIKANGNNLGVVATSMFINDAAVREDATKTLYLDRNLTITPQVGIPANSSVNIRLYIRNSEYQALKNAVNSQGQSSGITGINDLGIFKNDNNCGPVMTGEPLPVPTTTQNWESDYVLSGTINSFSTFYFLNKSSAGPIAIAGLQFEGSLKNNNTELNWETSNDIKTNTFSLERSIDGIQYKSIHTITAVKQMGKMDYQYTDHNIINLSSPVIYYRLKLTDMDNKVSYSKVISVNIDFKQSVILYPNPVYDITNLVFNNSKADHIQGRLVDNTGRLVKLFQWDVEAGVHSYALNLFNLAKGMFYLELKGRYVNQVIKVVKE